MSVCPKRLDPAGDHALSCFKEVGKNKDGPIYDCHRKFAETLARLFNEAGFRTLKEVRGIDVESDTRPADMLAEGCCGNRPAAIDFTVVSLFTGDVVRHADPLNALTEAEESKGIKYSKICGDRNIVFIPLAVSTMGNFSPNAASLLARLSRAYANHKHISRSDARTRINHALAMSIALSAGFALACRGVPYL